MGVDFLIKGGLVISGESPDAKKAMLADIAIEGDRIKAIGKFTGISSKETFDVKGLCVCPGFIDTHAHSEFTLLADGRAEGKIAQGVTTEINGNCGFSAAPFYGEAIEQREKELHELCIRDRWNTFDEYFQLLKKRGLAVNFMSLVGHGSIRASTAGYVNKQLTPSEKEKAFTILDDAFRSGAKGLSTGLMYSPGCYSNTAEIVDFVHVAKRYGGIYATHIRDEGDELLKSIDEVISIVNKTGVNAHISHLKTYGEKNWQKIKEVVGRLNDINRNDMVITCDRYPYTASCTSLDSLMPSWVFEGGKDEELKRLRNERKRLKEEIIRDYPDTSDWKTVIISSIFTKRNKWMEGKSIYEISIVLSKNPVDCFFDVLIEEELEVSAIFFSMSEENLKTILKLPYTTIGSDSSARCFNGVTALGMPHPRAFGTFPKIFRKYVREDGILSLSEAIYKMTGLPAKRFNIIKRGILKEGFFADITIFDPEKIKNTADYGKPFSKPEGIYYVFINGLPVIFDGKSTGTLPGRILRC